MAPIKRIEQGYPGHFCAARSCEFRRNTALVREDGKALVVSSVGAYQPMDRADSEGYETIGYDRFYECMVFVAELAACGCYQIRVEAQVYNDEPWAVDDPDDHAKAQAVHENQVAYWMEHFEEALESQATQQEQTPQPQEPEQ